jgi:hypothetical protein
METGGFYEHSGVGLAGFIIVCYAVKHGTCASRYSLLVPSNLDLRLRARVHQISIVPESPSQG